jgi:5'-deoxynucleotidase YfbR-like HD superfamily hydrolase
MEFLMHDSSEAYLIDLPRPIQRNMPNYVAIEEPLLEMIFGLYKLTYPLTDRVHEVDRILLHFEYDNFYTNPNPNFEFWSPKEAKAMFLARFNELKNQIDKK